MRSSDYHDCESMPVDCVEIYDYSTITESEKPEWVMQISRAATEEDLEENHYLEEEGQVIWTTTVAIKNCPYCGVELQKNSPRKSNGSCFVQHIDSSGYYSKVQ